MMKDRKGKRLQEQKHMPPICRKLIIEMLDDGTPSSVIAKKLESTCRLTCLNVEIIKLPNINCIRKQRRMLRILSECDVICLLAKNL